MNAATRMGQESATFFRACIYLSHTGLDSSVVDFFVVSFPFLLQYKIDTIAYPSGISSHTVSNG